MGGMGEGQQSTLSGSNKKSLKKKIVKNSKDVENLNNTTNNTDPTDRTVYLTAAEYTLRSGVCGTIWVMNEV